MTGGKTKNKKKQIFWVFQRSRYRFRCSIHSHVLSFASYWDAQIPSSAIRKREREREREKWRLQWAESLSPSLWSYHYQTVAIVVAAAVLLYQMCAVCVPWHFLTNSFVHIVFYFFFGSVILFLPYEGRRVS